MASITTNQQRNKMIISGILFLWSLSVFVPGAYSIDSFNQWNEVRSHHYDDWYGTGFATTWRKLWILTGNYISLYVFQMAAYWLFFTFLLREVSIKSIVYWLTIIGALFFLFIPQYIMRDSLMVLLWALACLLLLQAAHAARRRRRILLVTAILLIAWGLWVRVNMIIAMAPLVYVAIDILAEKPLALWKKLALTAGVVVVFFLGYTFITYTYQGTRRTYPEYKLKLLDLAGISKLSGENWFPDIIRRYPYFNKDAVLSRYSPGGIDDIYWPDQGKSPFPDPGMDSVYGMTTRSWHRAILSHPFYYIENRFEGFMLYLHLRERFPADQYYNTANFWIQPGGELPAKHEATPIKEKITKFYEQFYRTPVFDPWFWLLLNILGFAVFIVRYRRDAGNLRLHWLVHICIQLSGILYVLSQSPIYQSDRDFRYTYWNIIVFFFALVGFFSRPLLVPDRNRQPA